MLSLKHKHHFHLPRITLVEPSPMQLSPVRADDDELARAIDSDPQTLENDWELAERPDPGKLEAFWSEVETDLHSDPEWQNFAKE